MAFKDNTPAFISRYINSQIKDFDLRTEKEALERPDAEVQNVKKIHMPIFDESVVGISHERKVKSIKTLVQMPKMEELYVSMVSKNSQDNLVSVLKYNLLD